RPRDGRVAPQPRQQREQPGAEREARRQDLGESADHDRPNSAAMRGPSPEGAAPEGANTTRPLRPTAQACLISGTATVTRNASRVSAAGWIARFSGGEAMPVR